MRARIKTNATVCLISTLHLQSCVLLFELHNHTNSPSHSVITTASETRTYYVSAIHDATVVYHGAPSKRIFICTRTEYQSIRLSCICNKIYIELPEVYWSGRFIMLWGHNSKLNQNHIQLGRSALRLDLLHCSRGQRTAQYQTLRNQSNNNRWTNTRI